MLSTKGKFLAPQKINQVPVEVLQVLDILVGKKKYSKNPCSFQLALYNFSLLLIKALLGGFLLGRVKVGTPVVFFPRSG